MFVLCSVLCVVWVVSERSPHKNKEKKGIKSRQSPLTSSGRVAERPAAGANKKDEQNLTEAATAAAQTQTL